VTTETAREDVLGGPRAKTPLFDKVNVSVCVVFLRQSVEVEITIRYALCEGLYVFRFAARQSTVHEILKRRLRKCLWCWKYPEAGVRCAEAGNEATTDVKSRSKRKLLLSDRDNYHLEERGRP
jgi:hypothetical protein